MNSQKQYTVAEIKLRISDTGNGLLPFLHDELSRYSGAEDDVADCEMSMQAVSELSELPRGAVLIGHWHKAQLRTYRVGESDILHYVGRAVVRRNYRNQRVSVEYIRLDDAVTTASRIAMKWLLIKTAEQKGYTYVHASAVRIGQKNIAFVGNSGSGKSSSLLRMCQNGALAITDDCLLLKGGIVHPFCLRLTVCGDFASRFTPDPAEVGNRTATLPLDIDAVSTRGDLGETVCRQSNLIEIQKVYFPNIWNSTRSELRAITGVYAQQLMEEIYHREVSWNAYPESPLTIASRYRQFLKSATCYQLFAGSDEQALRKLYHDEIING